MRSINVLGATGTIGDNTLSVVREYRNQFKVKTLTASQNYQKLAALALEFNAEYVVIEHEKYYKPLKALLGNSNTQVHAGLEALQQITSLACDVTIVGISGIAGLLPTLAAIRGSKVVGLANKESIICAGDFIIAEAKQHGAQIIPVDSEHSALFQVLEEPNRPLIRNMVITASGGPFRLYTIEQMATVTPEQAVQHPNWQMGGKISVDSATLMNKGLEVIEAVKLFNIKVEQIEVVVHPESIMHGMINYEDGSSIAQLSHPSMRTPIAYAMFYPNRVGIQHRQLRLAELATLSFSEPDYSRFPLLKLAMMIANDSNAEMTALNVANEVGVNAFLQHQIGFLDIAKIVHKVVDNVKYEKLHSIADILKFAEYVQEYTIKL